MHSESIYLDYAATTPVRSEVLEAMMPFLTTNFGNPSAVYGPGRQARHVLEKCRAEVAELLGVGPAEILFTSGGSESNNTVLSQPFSHFVSSKIEHDSVREPLLHKDAGQVSWVEANRFGEIDPAQLEDALSPNLSSKEIAGLVSIMTVNNEIGSVNQIEALSRVIHSRGYLFHTDAVQAAGIMDLATITPHVDYVSLSGHKIGAPKGIGVLVIRAGAPYKPFVRGGSQEQDRRAGTENVASIVGFCKALRLASEERISSVERLTALRNQLTSSLTRALTGQIQFNGPQAEAVAPHIVSMVCTDQNGVGLDGEMLILGLDISGVYVSAGSACSSGTVKANSVLIELGVEEKLAKGAIRISLNAAVTPEQIDLAVARIAETINRMSGAPVEPKRG
ncbi:cysteine desulfurase [bacterium]|nr:cysteine desulfurase [bacterium]